MAEVRLQEGESLENALRRFKRKVQQEDIIKEIKKHSFTQGTGLIVWAAPPQVVAHSFFKPRLVWTRLERFIGTTQFLQA